MIALLNLPVLGFSLFVFHDKAKRTQQGNLLLLTPPTPFTVKRALQGIFLPHAGLFIKVTQTIRECIYNPPDNWNNLLTALKADLGCRQLWQLIQAVAGFDIFYQQSTALTSFSSCWQLLHRWKMHLLRAVINFDSFDKLQQSCPELISLHGRVTSVKSQHHQWETKQGNCNTIMRLWSKKIRQNNHSVLGF